MLLSCSPTLFFVDLIILTHFIALLAINAISAFIYLNILFITSRCVTFYIVLFYLYSLYFI